MTARFYIICAAMCLGCLVSSLFGASDDMRTITTTIAVVDEAGEPIEGLGIVIGVGEKMSCHLATDTAGRASCDLAVQHELSMIRIKAGPTPIAPKSSYKTGDAIKKSQELRELYSFQPEYRIQITPLIAEYSLVIHARPAVKISGRLVSPNGMPLSGNIVDRNSWAMTFLRYSHKGIIEMNGVARGRSTELVFMNDGNISRFLPLTADQTAADLDLGDVVLQPIKRECPVRIHIEPRQGLSLVLMNATTGEVFSSLLNKEGFAATRIDDEEGLIRVPAGRYYVMPGFLMLDKPVMELLDLIRTGKAKDHPDLPSFVATPDKEVAITIDPTDLRGKIKAAAEAEGQSESP